MIMSANILTLPLERISSGDARKFDEATGVCCDRLNITAKKNHNFVSNLSEHLESSLA